MEPDDAAVRYERAALMGFFGADGFADMSGGQRKRAMLAVLKEMEKDKPREETK